MIPTENSSRRPRTWAALRRRVLEEDYLSVGEIEHSRHRAHQMKYALGLIPLALAVLLIEISYGGPSLLTAVAIAGSCGGAIYAYGIGLRWERRWDAVIREKRPPSNKNAPLPPSTALTHSLFSASRPTGAARRG
jgi:hypothetical protein